MAYVLGAKGVKGKYTASLFALGAVRAHPIFLYNARYRLGKLPIHLVQVMVVSKGLKLGYYAVQYHFIPLVRPLQRQRFTFPQLLCPAC